MEGTTVSTAPLLQAATADAASAPVDALTASFGAVLEELAKAVMPDTVDGTDPAAGTKHADNDPALPDLSALVLPDALFSPQQISLPTAGYGAMPAARPAGRPDNALTIARTDATAAAPQAATDDARLPAKTAVAGEFVPATTADKPQVAGQRPGEAWPAAAGHIGLAHTPTDLIAGWASAPATPAAGSFSPTAAHYVAVPVTQPGWPDAFAQRIVWMVDGQQQSAELHVNPAELGPIDIVLSLDQDQAHVFFASAHSPVREAIETALPVLREALQQAGIQLGEASVSAETFGRQRDRDGDAPGQGHHPDAVAVPETVAAAGRRIERSGLVDIFA